jgi:hypothetical protein
VGTGPLSLQRPFLSAESGMLRCMVSWSEVEKAEPEFAARVRQSLQSRKHKTIATLRADGSPRISGIETEFVDGELTFGSMSGARKGADLRRDPRFALHGPTRDPPDGHPAAWPGEVKVAGRARYGGEHDAEESAGETFRADIEEVVFTSVNADASALVIEWWRPDRGLVEVVRA